MSYNFNTLLYESFPKSFLLNKVLNNNGFLSYALLRAGSCSLPDRADVGRFNEYIKSRFQGKTLLDIGCGPMSLPGYLEFTRNTNISAYGLDPIKSDDFAGFRVTGCSEFTPFKDQSFDAIVFATSLDHVCSLPQTILETFRILRPGGKVFVFMSDRTIPIKKRLIGLMYRLQGKLLNIKEPQSILKKGRYVYYRDDEVVFYLPPGAVDPFHSFFESPRALSKLFKRYMFIQQDLTYHNPNEVFLTYTK